MYGYNQVKKCKKQQEMNLLGNDNSRNIRHTYALHTQKH